MFIFFFPCIFHVEQYACSHGSTKCTNTLKDTQNQKKETFIFFHCQTDTDVSAVIVKIISHINYILMAY